MKAWLYQYVWSAVEAEPIWLLCTVVGKTVLWADQEVCVIIGSLACHEQSDTSVFHNESAIQHSQNKYQDFTPQVSFWYKLWSASSTIIPRNVYFVYLQHLSQKSLVDYSLGWFMSRYFTHVTRLQPRVATYFTYTGRIKVTYLT